MNTHTHRFQLLIPPEEHAVLQEVARQKGLSISELIRTAVREKYYPMHLSREQAVAQVLAMAIPLEDWERARAELAEARDAGLS